MLLCSVMLALFTLFCKFGTENTSYFLLVFLRFFVPLILLVPYLLWTASFKELFQFTHFRMQIFRAGSILVYQYAIFYYLMNSSLLDATVLQNTAPLFMPLLERLFFGHSFKKKVWLSILVSFAGVLCILQPDQKILPSLGIAAILAPLGQASAQVLYSHQARREAPRVSLFNFFFFTAIGSGIIYLFSFEFLREQGSLKNDAFFTWVNLIFLGLASILNQFFRSLAYRYGTASTLAPFLYFSLIGSAILDWVIFHHVPNWLSIAGAFLVIGGGMIQIYQRKQE